MTTLRELLEGKYEILGQLDEEGPGEVYKVRHQFLDEVRIVRIVPPAAALSRSASAGYLNEARAAMRLRHPNIAQLHDFSLDEEGKAFIVLEAVEGLPLDVALRELGAPPLGLALEIGQQALRALGYLHRGGRVHRQVGPERLVLTRDVDGRPLVKWTDLWISRLFAEAEEVPMGGLFPARPRRAAPEQFGAAGREPDARSDLYSFGLVLYELLTGRFPISGSDPFSWMAGHLSAPPLAFSESDPQGRLPAELREAVLQLLAKDPAQRPASAEELARRLSVVQDRFPDQGDYLDRALDEARNRSPALRPVVLPPKPEAAPPPPPEPPAATLPVVVPVPSPSLAPAPAPVPPPKPPAPAPSPVAPVTAPVAPPDSLPGADDLPLRGVAPARQLEWDRPRTPEYATQRVPIEPPAPVPVRPAPPVVETPAPPPAPAARPSGSRSRGIAIIAGIAVIALLGVAIGAFLGRKGDAPAASSATASNPATPPAGAAPSSAAPEAASPAPVTPNVGAPQVVEVEPKPAPPPPPDNEKVDPAATPLSRKERQELARLEAERRRLETLRAMPPPVQAPGGTAAKPPAGPMKRGDLITGGPGVEYPEPATEITAAYPAKALESRRTTKVRVSVLVDENGNVIQTRIREGDASGLGFNEAALEAARRVRFLPATRDGLPGKMWWELLYEFDPPAAAAPPPAPAAEAPPAEPSPPPPTSDRSDGSVGSSDDRSNTASGMKALR